MSLKTIAHQVSKLTFGEMMEFAEHLSDITILDDNGEEFEGPTVCKERMAANLSDWANELLEQNSN